MLQRTIRMRTSADPKYLLKRELKLIPMLTTRTAVWARLTETVQKPTYKKDSLPTFPALHFSPLSRIQHKITLFVDLRLHSKL